MNSIRAKVVCVLRNAERMLLICATDPHDGQSFLLPPGGGVEFGETLESAVRRELFEEVGIQLPAVRRVGMLETFFKFAGRPEHELVFVYEAECDAPDLCDRDAIEIIESNGERLPARVPRARSPGHAQVGERDEREPGLHRDVAARAAQDLPRPVGVPQEELVAAELAERRRAQRADAADRERLLER